MNKTNYEWHLPTNEVLNAMYKNKKNIGGFTNDYYSSSSEYSAGNAWGQYFGHGGQYYYGKYYYLRVRAVRALPEDHNETERIFKVKDREYQAYEKDSPEQMNWNEAIEYCKKLNK